MTQLSAQSTLGMRSAEASVLLQERKQGYVMVQSYLENERVYEFSGTDPEGEHELITCIFNAEDSCYVYAISTAPEQYHRYLELFRKDPDKRRIGRYRWKSRLNHSLWVLAREEQVLHIVNLFE